MGFLEKNIKIIEQRYPVIADRIKQISIDIGETVRKEKAQNGDYIISIKKNDRIWRLNSSWDPQRAAELYAERYNVRLYGIYFVFGFSDGRCIRELWSKCSDTNWVIVCVPDIKVFMLSCCLFDLHDILKNKKILLYFSELEDNAYIYIQRFVDYFRVRLIEFCILPVYDVLYPVECKQYMDDILRGMRNVYANKATNLLFDRKIPQNILYNMKRMIKCSNIEQLKEKLQEVNLNNIPAIIVSAGPSLDKNINELHKAQEKAFIIAVDASIRTVMKENIRPNLICSIDPNAPERFFERLDLQDVYWACGPSSNFNLLKQYSNKIIYYGSFGEKWNCEVKKELGIPFPNIMSGGGSVSTEAFTLAWYLGFKTIVLIGQDLAFTGGVVHTKGVERSLEDNESYIQKRHIVEVEGIDGSVLQTDYQMWFFKQWFERIIQNNKDVLRVIDATEGGAKIEGAEIRTLKEVIECDCKTEFPIYEIEAGIQPMFSLSQQQRLTEQLKYIKTEMRKFESIICDILEQEKECLYELKQNPKKQKEKLEKISEYNKIIEESDLFEYISMYTKGEEYDMGDSVYADENITPIQLIEKSLALLQGYQKGAKLFMEDFENIVLNDKY